MRKKKTLRKQQASSKYSPNQDTREKEPSKSVHKEVENNKVTSHNDKPNWFKSHWQGLAMGVWTVLVALTTGYFSYQANGNCSTPPVEITQRAQRARSLVKL